MIASLEYRSLENDSPGAHGLKEEEKEEPVIRNHFLSRSDRLRESLGSCFSFLDMLTLVSLGARKDGSFLC